ncbi:MAG: hypothetical protein CMM96_07235 [Rickettsiales bacterium]|nr:hypothetical protein [Rickettsiales bacterium]
MSEKNKKCIICYSIRYFIAAVILLIIVSLTMSNKLHYLSFITPENFAWLVIIAGSLVFIVKLFLYFKNKT